MELGSYDSQMPERVQRVLTAASRQGLAQDGAVCELHREGRGEAPRDLTFLAGVGFLVRPLPKSPTLPVGTPKPHRFTKTDFLWDFLWSVGGASQEVDGSVNIS